ncbi:MAG: hypothetical protein J6I31_09150 [Prevotella sp.]|nr:hypothetical protein [Prevotella sp.]
MNEELKKEINKQVAEMVAQMGAQGSGQLEVIMREGEALPLHEPVKVEISGVLDSPARWLEKRPELQQITNKCHVRVDREMLLIVLQINENAYYGTKIKGTLSLTDAFRKFHINDGHSFTLVELAKLFKMNRSFFETKQKAMELVTTLQNFKGKVNKDLEASNDNRGNKKVDFVQAVESNLPEAFTLHLPIFKGLEAEDVVCEVYVDPDDWSCQLISPDANDIVERYRDEEINKVLDRIEEAMPGVAIIEI